MNTKMFGPILNKGRTALHLAVNSRNGGTDVSFDVEDYLLKSGAKTDICDHRKRIPLHYAFVKIDTHNDSSFMDPIELVALLDPGDSPLQGQAIDVADEFGSTPLHYAAQRGATISCMHLLRRVNINPIDNNDNTPLGLAVLYKHEGINRKFNFELYSIEFCV
jgi:ankyrin repeat protein